jgi:hypothetical protein
MKILGEEYLSGLLNGDAYQIKMVFNENGAIFGPTSTEHKFMKSESISYEENYKGNAMAAMIYDGKIEIRFHSSFGVPVVRRFISSLFRNHSTKGLLGYEVFYQGKAVDMV